MIEIVKAPPFATVQDLGWRAGRAMGLPGGGAMHRQLLEAANHLVGNPRDAAGLEWALGPGTLRASREMWLAVLRDAEVRVEGELQPAGPMRLGAGTTVEITPRGHDRFLYVAVGGGIDVPRTMGSRSTYLPGGFGGYQGRRLKTGDQVPIGPSQRRPEDGAESRGAPEPAKTLLLRVTRGPQWERFDTETRDRFLSAEYTVAAASDRMGYRLTGPAVSPREPATLPSEAACPGAVQIPDGGEPIVLMPDGPTVGGYPKIAVVIGADLGELAQCPPGRVVRFTEIPLDQALSANRDSH